MLSLSFITEGFIVVRLGDLAIYYSGPIPFAFKEGRDVRIREHTGPALKPQVETLKLIENFSQNLMIELPRSKFPEALEAAYKRAVYAESTECTLKRMGMKNVSNKRNTRIIGNQPVRLIAKGSTNDKESA